MVPRKIAGMRSGVDACSAGPSRQVNQPIHYYTANVILHRFHVGCSPEERVVRRLIVERGKTCAFQKFRADVGTVKPTRYIPGSSSVSV